MLQRGAIIIYDSDGTIWSNSGEAQGDMLPPNVYPIGLPYIELPYGILQENNVISVDVSKEPHEVILEPIVRKPTYEELEAMLANLSE